MMLRREERSRFSTDVFCFELAYRPPLDWAAMVSFLGRRAVNRVEAVDGDEYYRTVRLQVNDDVHTGWIAATVEVGKPALKLTVSSSLAKVLPQVLSRAKHAFDLMADPQAIAASLGELADRHPGLRVPGSWDGFELLARAILGQQVTVAASRTLASRLAERFGESIDAGPAGLSRLFPSAELVAKTRFSEIQALGVVGSRARSLVTAAGAVASREVCLQPGADPQSTLTSLRRLPGVGEWTAQYVVMRALSWPDAFPANDHGVLKAMGESNPRRVLARAEAWRPWRSYAVMHLWDSLEH